MGDSQRYTHRPAIDGSRSYNPYSSPLCSISMNLSIFGLYAHGAPRTNTDDTIRWKFTEHANILQNQHIGSNSKVQLQQISKIPSGIHRPCQNIKFFSWLIIENRVWTVHMLQINWPNQLHCRFAEQHKKQRSNYFCIDAFPRESRKMLPYGCNYTSNHQSGQTTQPCKSGGQQEAMCKTRQKATQNDPSYLRMINRVLNTINLKMNILDFFKKIYI